MDGLVSHLRRTCRACCETWAEYIEKKRLCTTLDRPALVAATEPALQLYIDALANGQPRALEDFASNLVDRLIAGGAQFQEVLDIAQFLRGALVRSLFARYRHADERPPLQVCQQEPGEAAAAL